MADSPISRIVEAVTSGERTAESVTAAALDRIEQHRGLGAFVATEREVALAAAREVDRRRAQGEVLGPLAGVPIAVKDNICTTELTTGCASRMLRGFVSPVDATAISRLKAAGAVVIGKTNMDEFAMGSSGENSSIGPAQNPWDTARVPGGSSSGSAVSVAARLVPASLGSDTGGSIRQPAAFCGVVGFKPTYGRVSRRGLVACASSLDQIGPFATTVEDAARVFLAMAGWDEGDMTSSHEPLPALGELADDTSRPLRVGLPREYFADGLDPEVRAAIDATVAQLVETGAELVDISLPHTSYAVATYYIVASAEASSNLARFDGVRFGFRDAEAQSLPDLYRRSRTFGFGPEVRRRIMLGTFVLSAGYFDAYYGQAQRTRTLFVREFAEAFSRCDVLLTPTAPAPAFRFGENTADPLQMYLADIYTIPASLAGLPAISLPIGRTRQGLPIGAQLLAAPFAEATLFGAARRVEALRGALSAPPGFESGGL